MSNASKEKVKAIMPVLSLVFAVSTFIGGVVYATGSTNGRTKQDIEEIKAKVSQNQIDHDLLVKSVTRLDAINDKVDRIERKLDSLKR